MMDVSAAAAEQMRTAVAAHEARETFVAAIGGDDSVFWRARTAWVAARRAAMLADRAYRAACDEALTAAGEETPDHGDQPGLFDEGRT